MNFNLHKLDKIEPGTAEADEMLEEYQDSLIDRFVDSPEGQARLRVDPEMGFWVAQLIYYGDGYIGVTVPQMTSEDVAEIVTELFPRKISLPSPDDADDAIPELEAFWEYLKREYKLPNADSIMRVLHKVEPEFKGMMNDPSRFGMAKSFFMMGQSLGFDMTKKEDSNAFVTIYNASVLAEQEGIHESSSDLPSYAKAQKTMSKRKRVEKRKRKIAKASRRKGRKKR